MLGSLHAAIAMYMERAAGEPTAKQEAVAEAGRELLAEKLSGLPFFLCILLAVVPLTERYQSWVTYGQVSLSTGTA